MHNKLTMFGNVVLEICERTDKEKDRQTDKHTHTLITIYIASFPGPTNMQS